MVDNIYQCVHIGQIYYIGNSEGILIGHQKNGDNTISIHLFRFYKFFYKDLRYRSLVYYIIDDIEKSIAIVMGEVDKIPSGYGGSMDLRSDGKYHFKNEWELIKQNLFYYYNNKLWIPTKTSEGKIEYSFYSLSDLCQKIYDIHFSIRKLNDDLKIDFSSIVKKIEEFEDYVDSLDIDAILRTYKVGSWGFYKRVVGKDNYYCYGNYKRIDSEDNYIRSLLPIEDNSGYYNTDIQTEEEQDFDKIDNQEAERNISIAKHNYSKKDHVAFLMNDYYLELQKKKVAFSIYKLIFDEFFFFFIPIEVRYIYEKDKRGFVEKYNKGLISNLRKIDIYYINSLIDKIKNGYFK